jgi:hypothetical protein
MIMNERFAPWGLRNKANCRAFDRKLGAPNLNPKQRCRLAEHHCKKQTQFQLTSGSSGVYNGTVADIQTAKKAQ